MWREGVEQLPYAFPSIFDGSLCRLSQEQLKLCEDLLDGIEIGAVGRQEQELGACMRIPTIARMYSDLMPRSVPI